MFLDTIPDHRKLDNIARQDVHFSLAINSQDALDQQQAEELGETVVAHAVPADVLVGD